MKMLFPLLPMLLLAGCAVQVYNPERSEAETKADIDYCVAEAEHRFTLTMVSPGALHYAQNCLKAKGYMVDKPAMKPRLKEALSRSGKHVADGQPLPLPKPPAGPAEPCAVPCR